MRVLIKMLLKKKKEYSAISCLQCVSGKYHIVLHCDSLQRKNNKVQIEVGGTKDQPFSMVREAVHQVSTNWWKWVKILSFKEVETTQSACLEMMEIMGYLPIQNIENKGPDDLIRYFCPNRNITFCYL